MTRLQFTENVEMEGTVFVSREGECAALTPQLCADMLSGRDFPGIVNDKV